MLLSLQFIAFIYNITCIIRFDFDCYICNRFYDFLRSIALSGSFSLPWFTVKWVVILYVHSFSHWMECGILVYVFKAHSMANIWTGKTHKIVNSSSIWGRSNFTYMRNCIGIIDSHFHNGIEFNKQNTQQIFHKIDDWRCLNINKYNGWIEWHIETHKWWISIGSVLVLVRIFDSLWLMWNIYLWALCFNWKIRCANV